MRGTEYKHVYVLRNKDTGNYLLTYWASSQKHKALFSTRKKAEEAVKWIDDNANIEIVELGEQQFQEEDYEDGIYLCCADGYRTPFTRTTIDTMKHGLVTHIGIKVGEHKIGLKLNSLGERKLPFNADLGSDNFGYKEQEFYALDDYDGEANTDHIERHGEFEFDLDDDEWIPSLGELTIIFKYKDKLNDALTFVGGDELVEDWYWSSTEGGANITWFMNFSNGNVYSVYKFNNNIIRPVCAF